MYAVICSLFDGRIMLGIQIPTQPRNVKLVKHDIGTKSYILHNKGMYIKQG